MRMAIKFTLSIFATFAFASCATYSAIEPGPIKVAKGSLEVSPTEALWNKVPSMLVPTVNGEVWTAAGLPLDTITFISDLESGQTIFNPPRNSNTEFPPFKDDMLPNELAELVISSLSIQGAGAGVDMTELLPRQFAGQPGFDMRYTRTSQDEVIRRGRVAGGVIDGKLHLIMYEAARLHYFDQYVDEAEALIQSARLAALLRCRAGKSLAQTAFGEAACFSTF